MHNFQILKIWMGTRALLRICAVWLILFVSAGSASAESQGSKFSSEEEKNMQTWLDLSFEYRFSRLDSAFYYADLVLNRAREKKDLFFEAEALRSQATNYQAQGDFDKALELAFEALRLARHLGDSIKIAHTQNLIGMTYDQQGNFPGALAQYREAYGIYKSKNEEEWLAMIAVNLGILFKAQGAYEQVVPYYREAYEIYNKIGRPAEAAFCETNLGSIYYYTQQYDSCVYYSEKAERSLEEQELMQILPYAQTNAALGYFGLKKLDRAKAYFERALAFHRNSGSKKELAFLLIHLGKVYESLGQRSQAQQFTLEGKQVAEEIGSATEVMDAANLLANFYALIGDYRAAYMERTHYAEVRDTLFNRERLHALTNFQIQYDTEKKEQEIQRLNQETQIQRLKLRQRGLLLLGSILILTTVAVLIYVIQNKRKIQSEARLQQQATLEVLEAEERERRRIAADLHDGVGQLLSAALLNLNQTRSLTEESSEARKLLERSLAIVGESYDEMRSLSHQMMPNALLKSGLASSVKEFLSKIDGEKMKVGLEVVGLNERLDPQIETSLYRVIQEAVTNVVKHAEATRLSIQMFRDEEGITATIEDNGKGFDPTQKELSEGVGMKNIFSRINLLGGHLEVDSAPGRGTFILVQIPNKKG